VEQDQKQQGIAAFGRSTGNKVSQRIAQHDGKDSGGERQTHRAYQDVQIQRIEAGGGAVRTTGIEAGQPDVIVEGKV
jgi:hypothetical protein